MAKQTSDQRAEQTLIETVLVAAVKSGAIEPAGKTDDELEKLFAGYCKDFAQSDGPIYLGTDHTSDLLKRARGELKKTEYHYCALYYATWVEHWANWHVRCLAIGQRSVSERHIKDMLRGVNLQGKLTWLPKVLGGKQVAKKHLDAINCVGSHRNAFIHYKYPSFDVDEHVEVDPQLEKTLAGFERTVKYLQNFDNTVLRKGTRMKIKRFAQKI